MKTSAGASALIVGIVTALSSAFAQAPAGGADRVAALKQALAANKAALKQYTWIETTEISLKGEEKKEERKQCAYASDGSVTKTPLPDAAPAAPKQEQSSRRRGGGAVKKAIVSNKIDDMKEYVGKVKALVQDYVPPDPQRIQAAQAAGNVSIEKGTITLKDYVKPGDSMAIGLSPAGTAIQSFNLKSYVEKPKDDDVTMSVTYGTLPDGTSYPQRTVLNIAAKKLGVTVTNSEYRKVGS